MRIYVHAYMQNWKNATKGEISMEEPIHAH